MKTSIRWKLFGSYILLILVMGGAFYGYLRTTMERHLIEGVTKNLFNEAEIAALAISQNPGASRHDLPRLASEIGKRITARMTVISPDGTVVADSEIPADRLPEVENHLVRPEFRQALTEGKGSSTRYSSTIRTEMLYVAIPLQLPEGRGAIRLALPLTAVEQLKLRLHATLAGALALAALISLAMSSILSQRLYRPLRQMSLLAEEIGVGIFHRRLPIHRNDEFGSLSRVMNGMAERIQEQLHNLAAERNRLDAILRGMGEGLMVIDKNGTISLVNPAFCTLFDLQEEVTGRPLIDITRHPALNESFKQIVQSIGEHYEEIILPLGEDKTIMTHWVPLIDDGKLRGVVAVFHDITELKRLENIRKDFVANVSHELRTPVTVIKGYAETLLDGLITKDPVRALSFVSVILNHSERLALLISDLLALSEMESGEFSLHLRPLPLTGIIRHAANLFELKAEEKGIAVTLPPAGESPVVLADQGRLEQVFINLLDNAIKYTPSAGKVAVEIQDRDKFVTVLVSDNGPGIPPQSLPRIFERFYRVDSARSREQGGTGLGLSIVKHILQLHGGAISVESTPGKGAIFSVTLRKPD